MRLQFQNETWSCYTSRIKDGGERFKCLSLLWCCFFPSLLFTLLVFFFTEPKLRLLFRRRLRTWRKWWLLALHQSQLHCPAHLILRSQPYSNQNCVACGTQKFCAMQITTALPGEQISFTQSSPRLVTRGLTWHANLAFCQPEGTWLLQVPFNSKIMLSSSIINDCLYMSHMRRGGYFLPLLSGYGTLFQEITINSSRARQPLSCRNLSGFTRLPSVYNRNISQKKSTHTHTHAHF